MRALPMRGSDAGPSMLAVSFQNKCTRYFHVFGFEAAPRGPAVPCNLVPTDGHRTGRPRSRATGGQQPCSYKARRVLERMHCADWQRLARAGWLAELDWAWGPAHILTLETSARPALQRVRTRQVLFRRVRANMWGHDRRHGPRTWACGSELTDGNSSSWTIRLPFEYVADVRAC